MQVWLKTISLAVLKTVCAASLRLKHRLKYQRLSLVGTYDSAIQSAT